MERLALVYSNLHQIRECCNWQNCTLNIVFETEGFEVTILKDGMESCITLKLAALYMEEYGEAQVSSLDDLLSVYNSLKKDILNAKTDN